jgi:hypothetical protein
MNNLRHSAKASRNGADRHRMRTETLLLKQALCKETLDE